jgi:SAM-dependent MidA family methyltransferase
LPVAQAAGNDDLRQFILSRIREEGPAPFSRFMDWCLYHPQYGYYYSGEIKIGREGDYYTGPCVHPLFGGMVAKQLSQMSGILGGDTFTVLEIGGGRGFLGEDILSWAEKNDPEFYSRLQYRIMERAPSSLLEQQDRLSGEVEKGKVGWLAPGVLKEHRLSLEGCVLSNELVDAFPVHRVVCRGGELQEIYVGEENGRFVEIYDKLSDPRIEAFFSGSGINLADGQKAEVNLQSLVWLEDVGHCLRRGFLMTIDYGFPAAELYDSCRATGTLRCYFRHQASDNPYERLGRQDITSHVDFTSLIRKGEELGIRFTGLVPQYRFLISLGLIEEIDAKQQKLSEVEGLKLRLSIKHLLEPQRGMGEIFKVLIQHKGIEKPELKGLQDLRRHFHRNKGGEI